MTIEEETNQEIWYVLQRIKKADIIVRGKPFFYKLTKNIISGVPSADRQKSIIHMLHSEEKAVKIIEKDYWESGWRGLKLRVLQPKFDEVYKKYGILCDPEYKEIQDQNVYFDFIKNRKNVISNKSLSQPRRKEQNEIKPKLLSVDELPEDLMEPVWWVLKRIKREYLAADDYDRVIFKFVVGEVLHPGQKKIIPNLEDQKISTRFLVKLGAIEVDNNYKNSNEVHLKVLESKFNEVNNLLEKKLIKTQPADDEVILPQEVEPPSVVSADLTALLSKIEAETDNINFYFKVAAYGKYLMTHTRLNPVLKDLYEQSKRNGLNFIKKWQEFFVEWKQLGQELVDLADEEGMKGNPDILHQDLARLKQRLAEPELSFFFGDIYNYYRPYCDLISTFVREGKANLVVPKYLNENQVTLTIDKKYDAVNRSWDLYKKERENEPWWAHYQIMRLTCGILELPESATYFKDDNIVDTLYKVAFREISEGKTTGILVKTKFLEWVKTLHNYLIPRIMNLSINSGKTPALDTRTRDGSTMTKRERQKEFNRVKKICGLSDNEEKLLEILFDFQPHNTKDLESEVPTKALSHLKKSLNKKIEKEGYLVHSDPGGGFNKSFYTLQTLNVENA